jgi:hypothetical protein
MLTKDYSTSQAAEHTRMASRSSRKWYLAAVIRIRPAREDSGSERPSDMEITGELRF